MMANKENKKNKQKLSSIFHNNFYMLKQIAKYTPDLFLLMVIDGVLCGFIDSAMAVFNFNLLNTVDGGSFSYALKIILYMASFYIAYFTFGRWYSNIRSPLMRKRLHLRMHSDLFMKAQEMDLSCFDDPEFYNDFVWAMNESDGRAIAVLEDTGKLINRIVACGTMFGILLTVDPIIACILLASCTVTIICNMVGNKISFKHGKENNPLWRKKSYINRVYHIPDYAKEMRIRHADDILMKEYDENTQQFMETDRKYGKKYFFVYGLGWNALGNVTYFSILLYMLFLLSRGDIAVGGFAASAGVVFQVRWMLNDMIERLTKYPKHSLYIEKYLEFVRLEPQIQGGITEIEEFESLELRDVSFSYEFANHPKYQFHSEDHVSPADVGCKDALKNVSLTIRRGEKVAIVGYNGAGKTTLIKLLMRLYDPSEGQILYNGRDIKEFDPHTYRRKIGTVFQDFKIFATSIAQNVMNGHYEDTDEQTVLDALEAADFTEKLQTLEKGIHTHLTREFDDKGTNLSGGESQKIAIARVFAHNYPIVIMDEPSSALDPMAEYHLNQSILHQTEGKTVIFISHRLSTTRFADRIYMFDSGHLIETGSHDSLLAQNGKYAEMFHLQSEKYRKNTED